jgi:hypothetical protein
MKCKNKQDVMYYENARYSEYACQTNWTCELKAETTIKSVLGETIRYKTKT